MRNRTLRSVGVVNKHRKICSLQILQEPKLSPIEWFRARLTRSHIGFAMGGLFLLRRDCSEPKDLVSF